MSENIKYCMGCMKALPEGAVICPECHYSADSVQQAPYLPLGVLIKERYLTGKVIAMANDSVTYIGLDTFTQTVVTVREYYPHKIAHRANGSTLVSPISNSSLYDSCLDSFINLWRGVSMISDVKCLPKVIDIFSENDTAYCICESKETMSLKAYFEKTRKPLTYSKAIAAFIPLLNALKVMHNAGIVHGSITPTAIQVGSDGRLNLNGFTIPQCRSDIPELAAKPVSGFSPLEVYESNTVGPESDIYSLMAVLYYSITGTVLPKATDRIEKEKLTIPSSVASVMPKNVLNALARSLSLYPQNRISSAEELVNCLRAAHSQPSAAAGRPTAERTPAMQRTSSARPAQRNTSADRPARPKPKPQTRVPEKEEKETSLVALGLATFTAAVVVISIIFCALYSTVLYKNYNIPFLNKALSSMVFLPMNKEKEPETQVPEFSTEEAPSASETAYATVADFTKLTYDYIISNESFKRNFVFDFRQEASDTVEKGGIISQDAIAGESVPVGTEIRLVVSTGVEQIVVPDVKGKSFEEAKEILENAKLKVEKEVLENTENKTPDEVYSMSADPGSSVDKGTTVTLSVWDKVPETTTTAPTTTEKAAEKTTEAKKEQASKSPSTTKKETTTKKAVE